MIVSQRKRAQLAQIKLVSRQAPQNRQQVGRKEAGRKGEAMSSQSRRLRGAEHLGTRPRVLSLVGARLPPFPDGQSQCALRGHEGRGTPAVLAPWQPDPPIPPRLVAVARDQLPLASLQGLPGKTGIPALPPPPLACRSRVGGHSRLAGIPPQSSALEREGRDGREGRAREL